MTAGPGFRVPLVLISPWSRGNIVVSEVMDHTSVLKFVEARFNVTFPVISPWRRAMMGDLTSAFNWSSPDYSWPSLPDTSGYVNASNVQCDTLPPVVIPSKQTYPVQESGTRISRALPYQFVVSDAVVTSSSSGSGSAALALNITNVGSQGSPFTLLDVGNLAAVTPRKYAVEGGKTLVDSSLPVGTAGSSASSMQYYYALHGPNGFVRLFLGDLSVNGGIGAQLSANLTYDVSGGALTITMTSSAPAGQDVVMSIVDNAYGAPPQSYDLPGGESNNVVISSWPVCSAAQGCWYDVTVNAVSSKAPSKHLTTTKAASDPVFFQRRFMGRMETGVDTISDPAMGAGIPGYVPQPHTFATEEQWHAAMDAAFPVGVTGSRAARPALAWSSGSGVTSYGGIIHPDTPTHLRVVPREGSQAQATHKDALWHWAPDAAGEL